MPGIRRTLLTHHYLCPVHHSLSFNISGGRSTGCSLYHCIMKSSVTSSHFERSPNPDTCFAKHSPLKSHLPSGALSVFISPYPYIIIFFELSTCKRHISVLRQCCDNVCISHCLFIHIGVQGDCDCRCRSFVLYHIQDGFQGQLAAFCKRYGSI